MKKMNIVYAIAIIGLGLFAGLYAMQYKSTDRNLSIGADFFPMLMSGGLVLTGCIILIGAVRDRVTPGEEKMDAIGLSRLVVFMLGCIAYFSLVRPLGFIIASALMVTFCMLRLGCRQWRVIAVYSVALPAVVFYMFYYLMYVDLPLGLLEPILPKY